jgi:hypothetical protein
MKTYKEILSEVNKIQKKLDSSKTIEEEFKVFKLNNSSQIEANVFKNNKDLSVFAKSKIKSRKHSDKVFIFVTIIGTIILQNILWFMPELYIFDNITILGRIFIGFLYIIFAFYENGFFQGLINLFMWIIVPFLLSGLLIGLPITTALDKYSFNKKMIKNPELNKKRNDFERLFTVELNQQFDAHIRRINDVKRDLRIEIENLKTESNNMLQNLLPNTINQGPKTYSEIISIIENYSYTGLSDRRFSDLIKTLFNEKYVYYNLENTSKTKYYRDYLLEFQRNTLILTDQIMIEERITEYGIVDITRSTNESLSVGTYFYSIQNNGDLIFMEAPYYIHYDKTLLESFALFDLKKYEEAKSRKKIISAINIYDFQLFGSELMESTVRTTPIIPPTQGVQKVSVFGTLFNEFLFGSSYTILNGMGKMMGSIHQQLESLRVDISTIHNINDTRKVQLIFKDQTDIELKGIAIYYDFNRKMGRVKNKVEEKSIDGNKKENIAEQKGPIQGENNNDLVAELIKIKELLKDELITKEEFDELKKEILKKK